ncbi:MAG TPA: hypothetical protein VH062_15885 [Polyangiaceae bacterium]|nr:hypothetical protein [Polyangiaceae bacterium]
MNDSNAMISAGITALIAISLCGACGASADLPSDHADNGASEDIGTVSNALTGDTSSCLSDPPDYSVTNISPSFRGDVTSTEPGTTQYRTAHCAAWTTQFSWSTATTGGKEYYFDGTSNPMPGDQSSCQGVWDTQAIYGALPGGWHQLIGSEYNAVWEAPGDVCAWPDAPVLPSGNCFNDSCHSDILQLWNASTASWTDWANSWKTVRVINQPFYIYWAIPSSTILEVNSR